MYNLTVATAHTYFVGEGAWLVHNTCSEFPSVLRRYLNAEDYNYFLKNGKLPIVNGRSWWTETSVTGTPEELVRMIRTRNTAAFIDVNWSEVPDLSQAQLVDSPFGATTPVRFRGFDLEYIWSWNSGPYHPSEIHIPSNAIVNHNWNPLAPH